MQWWISNKYALYERMNVKVKAYHNYVFFFERKNECESEGLPHLRFRVFHFPGHGNQHTLVK